MKPLFTLRKNCRICKSDNLIEFINLGKMPLADLFLTDPTIKEHHFPLEVKVCPKCFLVQLTVDVNSELLFGQNYGFYTGGSPTSLAYFENYANSIMNRFPKECKKFLVEIASNDGTFLKPFIQKGYAVLGVDPAQNVAEEAKANQIPTLNQFFNRKTAQQIVTNHKKANIIVANNVIAHVENLPDFLQGIKILLNEKGIFIFECQYFPYLLFNNQFDNIYHEHRSFFSLTPLVRLFKKFGLEIFDLEEHDTQGGSIRVFSGFKNQHKIQTTIKNYLENEKKIGITDINIYLGFQARVNYIRIKLNQILKDLKNNNKVIAGYGASAKSNTLLNYCKINTNLLDYIVDKTPYKYGLYSPGMHIPIISSKTEKKKINKPDYYLLLVWNYADKIIAREKEFVKRGGKFIIPVPTPHIK